MIKNGPNPNEAIPNPNTPSLCFIKNVVKNPRIINGDYTNYDDVDDAGQFEKHVTHFYDFIGDRQAMNSSLICWNRNGGIGSYMYCSSYNKDILCPHEK